MAKSTADWVTELINGKSQAYPHMPRQEVIDGLRDRLADPSKIDQDRTSLCGPAALLYCLAKDKKEAYAQYIVELYHTGKSKIGSLEVEPSEDCRNYKPGKERQIHPVDWVGLASLRDSENDFLDYQSPDDEAAGITMPGALMGWFKSAGFTNVTEECNLVITKDKDTLMKADTRYKEQNNVCLFINAKVFGGQKKAKKKSGTPNHWVVMSSQVSITNNEVDVTVYTWGTPYRKLTMGSPKVTVEEFCNHFYGYVSAKG